MLRYELYETKKKCLGDDIDYGHIATLQECAEKCKNVKSMFIYGRTADVCTMKGMSYICVCSCESKASPDGHCTVINNINYDLYRFIQKGKIFLESLSYNSYQLIMAESVFDCWLCKYLRTLYCRLYV